ncbi:MAG: Monocarboxylate 2-oxoacid-binding periplasmic protein [Anaerolineae bacterium]|nr:Monocarboxylate 2-oxoacid-binding periplasmic protein [Anaerolineae bacterium]
MEDKLNRRDFLKKASVAAVAGSTGLLVGCSIGQDTASSAPTAPAAAPAQDDSGAATQTETQQDTAAKEVNVNKNQTVEWKMVTTWPPTLPVLQEGANFIAQYVDTMSQGRLKIHVYGAGELVGALETFDAVQAGTAEMGHGASYYWAGKAPAAQFFAAVPFGMNAQQMNAWLLASDGLKLWEETYTDFGLVPFPAGNTGVQMGGWFNKEINSIADFNGLKMRIPGLGGKVIAAAGGSAELIAGGEIYTSLERGVIDATEWVGPYHDYVMGFYKVAKFYYYPGWHEPGTVLESIINRKAWDALSPDLQEVLRQAIIAQNASMLAQSDAQNNFYLQKMINEENVDLRPFPDDVMKALHGYALDVLDGVAASDPMSKKVYDSFRKFQKDVAAWGKISEKAFYNSIEVEV